jgi:hypothetical protein
MIKLFKVCFLLIFFFSKIDNAKASFMLDNWGLQIADQSVELQGRVVDREKICLADGDFDSGQNADWGNQLTRGRAFEAVCNYFEILSFLCSFSCPKLKKKKNQIFCGK